ncbi:MAG TPA: hypothetical protein PLJ35_14115 [Anaerolineae bacterium]|nr:hypothetical protein [Anaerolineae bacterium]HOQ99951.1 hypothetical protein [Anaerolineae bacterium]HPL27881.1 hypothetical protein [Anaerolineae bacterium]
MKIRSLGALAVTSFALTLLWLGLLVVSLVRSGLPGTFDQMLASLARPDPLYYLTYANATVLTLVVTALFAGLFAYCEPAASGWSLIGFVFVPVYCLLNLVVYLGQITVVPQLVALQQVSEYQAVATVLLRMTIQQWPGSAAGIFNNLAYAILGVPSLIYGGVLARGRGIVRLGGVLLALNGVACIMGMVGVVLQNSTLSLGSLAGGALFLLALLPLAAAFLREGASWRAQM